jgi:beta-phosphoglucomutase
MAIKGLIFDLDGTVTFSQQFHVQAFSEVFKNHGLTYTAEDDLRYAGKGPHCIFPEFFQEHGIKLTPEQTEQYSNEKKEIYDRIIHESKIEEVKGLTPFLERMKKLNMKMVVASGNKVDAVEYLLKKINARKYFEAIVTNKDVKKSKPDPDIFLKGAEILGLKPEECIVFEDAANGVKAAQSAGMASVCVLTTTPRESLVESGADIAVKDYTGLTDEMILSVKNSN